jgi:hypothetical protein
MPSRGAKMCARVLDQLEALDVDEPAPQAPTAPLAPAKPNVSRGATSVMLNLPRMLIDNLPPSVFRAIARATGAHGEEGVRKRQRVGAREPPSLKPPTVLRQSHAPRFSLDISLRDAVSFCLELNSAFDVHVAVAWHSIDIYRRALVDLNETHSALIPPEFNAILAASLSLGHRLVGSGFRELSVIGNLADFFCLKPSEISPLTWQISEARNAYFACACGCPFDVAAQMLFHFYADFAPAPPGTVQTSSPHTPSEWLTVDKLPPAVQLAIDVGTDHLLTLAASSRRPTGRYVIIGAAAALCAIRALHGPIADAAFEHILASHLVRPAARGRSDRAAVLTCAYHMRTEHLLACTERFGRSAKELIYSHVLALNEGGMLSGRPAAQQMFIGTAQPPPPGAPANEYATPMSSPLPPAGTGGG